IRANNNILRINNVTSVLNRNLAIETQPFDVYNLDDSPKTSAELSKEDALRYFEQMSFIRKMETAIGKMYTKKIIRGFCHLYSGEEAISVGLNAIMRPQDTVITSYRCHAWTYLMGDGLQPVIAELLGKKSGCSRGKGGSMHMYVKNFYGGNGIVGAHVPLGTGVALAHQYKKDDGICTTLFGDGASNQGQVFEAYNIAKLLSLPVIYGIENNNYAMGTSVVRSSAMKELYKKGNYVPGIRLDGMDVLAVREACRFAFDYIKSGKGPIILEFLTYRYGGHSMSDPGTSYRTREEVEEVRKNRDPLKLLKDKVIGSGLVTEDELKQIDEKAKKAVKEATDKSVADTEIAAEEVAYDIYSNYKGKVKMVQWSKYLDHKNVGFKPINL
ncbi:hypothetical protein NQ318_022035, partial [Aromia moschata]